MPCFHTHWLVALQTCGSTPKYIKDGWDKYKSAVNSFRRALIDALNTRASDPKQTRSQFRQALNDQAAKWQNGIRAAEEYDAITCFSAYMLGACGPDFWTVPSHSRVGLIPDTASQHFDLGHYNRTHHQFELSVADVGGANRTDLPSLVQRAYFLGMATHIAADVVVHQLVNFSAGAYNLLEACNFVFPDKAWQNEDWTLRSTGKNIWNTHNKIEHYWDSHVRYRYLGDQGPFWPEKYSGKETWFDQLGFPTTDSLIDYAKRNYMEHTAVFEDCKSVLTESLIKYVVEKPLMFPWVFCDRVTSTADVTPFIYRLVVGKGKGSYPAKVAPKKATKEARSFQMADEYMKSGHSERKKLNFFSTKENSDDDPTSFNFLTYHVCPNVQRTKAFGFNVFYHLPALKPFLASAVAAARTFVEALSSAYKSGNPRDIGPLGYFWNLDTGLGLRITPGESDTDRECITELNFVHVFDMKGVPGLDVEVPAYVREEPYKDGRPEIAFGTPEGPPLYPTYLPDKPFDTILSVQETRDDAYLEQIKLVSVSHTPDLASMVATCGITPVNVRVSSQIAQRLNLRCKIAIADFKAISREVPGEELAMFFMGDRNGPPGQGVSDETRDWLADNSAVLEFRTKPSFTRSALQHFVTHILVNTDRSKDAVRKIGACDWNNVIPYRKTTAAHGRNFAISTGRRFVLRSRSGGAFNPLSDFECYTDVSPTEHVFFTLYALALKDGEYYDLLSKETVDVGEIAELKRIDETGVVKIVLIYKFAVDGSLLLTQSYVDGLLAKP